MRFDTVILAELLQPKGYIRGPFGSALKRSEMLSVGIPVYEQQHAIYNNRIFRFFISENKLEKMSRFQVEEDDLIISCSGTVGKVSIIRRNDPKGIISQALLLLRVDKKKILPQYLKYYFDSSEGYNAIISRSSGSVQVNIAKREIIENIPILVPNIEMQQKICSVLKYLDDKIALNTAINENLEQQAQAIFKAWFVDFEPFGGVMPDDWQDISVYDLANYINGAAFKKAEYGNFGLPIIKIAELKSGITDSTQFCCVSKESKYYIDDKDILFSWSGNPDTSIDTFLWSRGRAILNQHTFRVVSKFNAPAFTYFLLKYLKPQFAHIASNKQTTGLGHVTVADLKRLQFCANEAVIMDFEILTAPIFETIFSINKENQHLAVLRDTLLPKLMNGEIDVSEVKI